MLTKWRYTLDTLLAILLWLFAYLLGSLSTALLLCKLFNWPDPRQHGSHNPGATNMLRLGGRWAAAATLGGDLLKGVIPVLIAQELTSSASMITLTGLSAVLGHLYPVFFGFRGGKGVATALGVALALNLVCGIGIIAVWLGVFAYTRVASLASLISWLFAPLIFYWWLPDHLGPMLLMSFCIIYRHFNNIVGLLRGTERRL